MLCCPVGLQRPLDRDQDSEAEKKTRQSVRVKQGHTVKIDGAFSPNDLHDARNKKAENIKHMHNESFWIINTFCFQLSGRTHTLVGSQNNQLMNQT